jgi:hypothetical protein
LLTGTTYEVMAEKLKLAATQVLPDAEGGISSHATFYRPEFAYWI